MSLAFAGPAAYLTWDHNRVLRLLDEIEIQVHDNHIQQARRAYARVQRDYLRHLRLEEELVFPVFAARAGLTGGPTVGLREEHGELRRALELMDAGLAAADAKAFDDGLSYLRAVLPGHRSKEERLLFPTMDSLLSGKERQAFVDRLQRE